jgi:hypothetical protein
VPLTVRERAETVATLRHIEITLMETLAGWVPTTPMMEVKVLFGRHIWETAQHADILGKRTYELRSPMHFTLAPAAEYAAMLADVAATDAQAQRVSAFYDVMLPAMISRCREYLSNTDTLLDEPTVRIVKRIIADTEAMIEESRALRNEQSSLALVDAGWRDTLIARERAIPTFVARGAA